MCSPQQAVGAPALGQELIDLKQEGDAQTSRDFDAMVQSEADAKRETRDQHRRALINAGKRFGRGQTVSQASAGRQAVRGTLGRDNFQRRALEGGGMLGLNLGKSGNRGRSQGA